MFVFHNLDTFMDGTNQNFNIISNIMLTENYVNKLQIKSDHENKLNYIKVIKCRDFVFT